MKVCWHTHLIGSNIITKFMLPSMGDIKFSNLNFDNTCTYMNDKYAPNMDSSKYLAGLMTYCNKIKPFVSHYSNLIKSYNDTIYNILENEIKPLFPQISRQKCAIVHYTSFRFHRPSL